MALTSRGREGASNANDPIVIIDATSASGVGCPSKMGVTRSGIPLRESVTADRGHEKDPNRSNAFGFEVGHGARADVQRAGPYQIRLVRSSAAVSTLPIVKRWP